MSPVGIINVCNENIAVSWSAERREWRVRLWSAQCGFVVTCATRRQSRQSRQSQQSRWSAAMRLSLCAPLRVEYLIHIRFRHSLILFSAHFAPLSSSTLLSYLYVCPSYSLPPPPPPVRLAVHSYSYKYYFHLHFQLTHLFANLSIFKLGFSGPSLYSSYFLISLYFDLKYKLKLYLSVVKFSISKQSRLSSRIFAV